mgnify:CR=1 FL=1
MAERLATRFRTALVTGASTGLGRAFARMLLAEGVAVWGTSRDAARLADLTQEHPQAFHPVVLELADAAAAAQAFRAAEQAAGGFDLVVNNAGFGAFGVFADTDFAVWREQLEVMLVNTTLISHLALVGMRQRNRGALVNVSSLAAEFPLPFQSAYNMAKAGLTALNESLMIETAGTGVVVLDVRPGDYRTDFEGSVTRLPGSRSPRAARSKVSRSKRSSNCCRVGRAVSTRSSGAVRSRFSTPAATRTTLARSSTNTATSTSDSCGMLSASSSRSATRRRQRSSTAR